MSEIGDEDGFRHINNMLVSSVYLFKTAPFELFMSVIQKALGFRLVEALQTLAVSRPNEMHAILSYIIENRLAKAVITTNFDSLIESCFLHKGDLLSDVTYDASKTSGTKLPRFMKIHGSMLDLSGNLIARQTLCTTVDAIYKNRRDLLSDPFQAILSDATVLVLGYRGADRVDVMAALSRSDARRIYWVRHAPGECKETAPAISTEGLHDDVFHLFHIDRKDIRILHVGARILLNNLTEGVGVPSDEIEKRTSQPSIDHENRQRFRGFLMTPIFQKYAFLVSSYLLIWSGISPAAAEFGLVKFIDDWGNDEHKATAYALSHLSRLRFSQKDPDESERFAEYAIRLSFDIGDHYLACYALNTLANTHLKLRNNSERAIELFERAAALSGRAGHHSMVSYSQLNLASSYASLGQLADEERALQLAASAAQSAGDFWLEGTAAQRLAMTDLKHGDADAALVRLLQTAEAIYLFGGGSHPDFAMAALVDPFSLENGLVDAIGKLHGARGADFARASSILGRIDLGERVALKIKRAYGSG